MISSLHPPFICVRSCLLGSGQTCLTDSIFNAYCLVVLTPPPNRHLSNQTRTDRIRTTPAVPARGRKRETVGQFDVALVIEDKVAYPAGVGFAGMFDLLCLMLNGG